MARKITRLRPDGKVTIPAFVRRALGVGSGDSLGWSVEGKVIRVTEPVDHTLQSDKIF
jgi:bifunctional DNA-binding transcriptional regulator/antitoxin component of YhaV-PrlF toxin-antitoxin module